MRTEKRLHEEAEKLLLRLTTYKYESTGLCHVQNTTPYGVRSMRNYMN